jgi:tetratricopeptide (TPR) repeat protein
MLKSAKVLGKAPQEQYSRQDVRRMLDISEQQLRGWQRHGFIPAAENYTFSDLIALRALQKLRANRIPSKQIGRAIVSLKRKLSDIVSPLSELKIVSNGRSIAVHIAGQRMEAISGQMLFDFETAELASVRSFPQAAKANRAAADEKQAELWFQRGLELEESEAPIGDTMEAYQKAIELNPSAAGALVNLGTIHYHLRKFKEAADYYQRAVDVDPRYALAHFNLGNLCDEQGQVEKAFEHYGTALRLSPDYADAHYNVALLCEQTGDFLKATRHWKAYLKVDNTSSWAGIARRQLEKLRQVTVVTKS